VFEKCVSQPAVQSNSCNTCKNQCKYRAPYIEHTTLVLSLAHAQSVLITCTVPLERTLTYTLWPWRKFYTEHAIRIERTHPNTPLGLRISTLRMHTLRENTGPSCTLRNAYPRALEHSILDESECHALWDKLEQIMSIFCPAACCTLSSLPKFKELLDLSTTERNGRFKIFHTKSMGKTIADSVKQTMSK